MMHINMPRGKMQNFLKYCRW